MLPRDKDNMGILFLILMFALCILAVAYILMSDIGTYPNSTVGNISFDVFGMIICTIIHLTMFLDKRNEISMPYFMCILLLEVMLLFWDIIGWLIDGKPSMYLLNNALNYYLYGSILLIIAAYWLYLREMYREHPREMKAMTKIVWIALAAGMALIVCNVFTGVLFTIDPDTSVYTRSDTFYLSSAAPVIMTLVSIIAIVKFEGDPRRKIVLLTYILIPLAAMFVQLFTYGSSLQYFAMMFSVVLMYVNIHLGRSTELINNEIKMSRQRAAVMVSQIQPHFLYNALTAIMNIKGNPPETREAIADFGHYLRKNLDSISQNHPIPIERELDHVETYLTLRQLKYGDRIHVRMELDDQGFFIPPYTVKIILESAIEYNVVHGVRALDIMIRTDSTDRDHVLIISDHSPSQESLEFVTGSNDDIEILRARVKNMVGGDIENLIRDDGTLDCIITIPKRKGGMA